MEWVNGEQQRGNQRDPALSRTFFLFDGQIGAQVECHEVDGGYIQTVKNEIAEMETERVLAPDRVIHGVTEVTYRQILKPVGGFCENTPDVEVTVYRQVYQEDFIIPDEAIE